MCVSVIMPAKNAAGTIRESIESVLRNRLVSQLIIVDDQSTDETAAICAQVHDNRIEIVSGDGYGISAALNIGFASARYDYISRCDSDDLYPSDRIDRQYRWLGQNPDFVAISGGFQTITMDGRPIVDLACEGPAREVTGQLLRGEPVTHFCTWLTRSSALRSINGAREWFVTAEDLDLMFRLAAQGKVWHEPLLSYYYRLHEFSITHHQPTTLRVFYEHCAKDFARVRSGGDHDPLMKGTPPAVPIGAEFGGMSAKDQAINQIIGSAWSAHAEGRVRDGLGIIARGLMLRPFSLTLWRNVLFLLLKSPLA